MAWIKFKSKTIDLKDNCLFCLDKIAKYSVSSECISKNDSERSSVPDLNTIFKYLQINLASNEQFQGGTFSSLTKCDKFLCLGCFELVTEIGKLYVKLEEVKAQIEEQTGKVRNVIVERGISSEEGERRKELEEKLEGIGKGRRTRGGGRQSQGVEFVEVFQNLVKHPERRIKDGQLDLDDKVTPNQDEVKLIDKDDIQVDRVEIVNSETDPCHQAKRTFKTTTKKQGHKRPISRSLRKRKPPPNLKADVDVNTKDIKIECDVEEEDSFEDLDTEETNFPFIETDDITDMPVVPNPSGHREASSLHKTQTQEVASPLPARTFKVKIEVKRPENKIDKVKREIDLEKEEVASEEEGGNADSDPDNLDDSEDEWFPWRSKRSKDFGPRKCFQPVKPKPKKCLEVSKRSLRRIKRDYKCSECEEVFISSSQYIRHYKRQHAEEVVSRIQIPTTVLTNPDESKKDRQMLQCSICDYQTLSKLSDFRYYEHMLSHEEDANLVTFEETTDPYSCNACGKVFMLKINHLLHKMVVHDPRREILKCELCCVKIFGREEFIEHLKLHSDTVYSCKSCPMSSVDMPTLLEHMSTHAGRKRLICPACDHLVMFPTHRELIRHCKVAHEVIVKKLDCPQCDKSYITPNDLRVHRYQYHANHASTGVAPNNTSSNCDEDNVKSKDTANRLQNKKKPYYSYPCDKCERVCYSRSALRGHIQVVHENTPYLCPHCPSTFTSEWTFKYHLKLHTGENLVNCLVCGKKFPSGCRLRKHMKTTHEKAKVICEVCGKECVNQIKLRRHMQIVHTEKKYDCPHCDFKFKRLDHLTSHVRTHSGERPFVCKVCGKGFNRRDIMRIHWRVHGLSSTLTPDEEAALQKEPNQAN